MSSDLEGDEPELNDIQGEEIVCETYYVLRSDDQDDDTDSTIQSLEGGQRPVRPVERQKMRPWMVELLDNNTLPGLSWQNKKENIFRISWKHAAHNCFNRNRDSDLFERWAFHTGRHHEGNHKRWKANFRCALNSLPDVLELKDLGVRKGDNAFKVYKFLDTPDPTMEEKLRIKQKYSLSNLKAEGLDPLSGSSTPTSSTAPSSPDGQTIADGGIQTLLKAIELKSQQGGSKPSQKRAASGGTTTGRGKRAKKAKEREKVEEEEIEEEEVIETVIHSSSTGEGGINVQNVPLIDSKTGKVTYVQLRTAESVETDTNQLEVSIQSARTSTITSPTVVQTETSQAITLTEPKDLVEKNISIPIHLFQQELQKQTNKFPGIINLSTLLAGALPSSSGTVLTGIPAAGDRAGDTGGQTIPFTVLEQIQQARLKELQKMVSIAGAENTLPKTVTEQTASSVSATETVPSLPQAQVNRNITSIAAALRMTPPQTKQSQTPTQVTTATLTPTGVMAQDPQGIRSKLVSRLMVSGSTMTSQAQNLRMQSPTTAPRPRLDQILVKPNPVLNLPKTQLQPVRTTDVITSAVSSSNQEAVLRIVPGSERSLDVKSQLQVEALRDLDPGISSLLSSAEARADILDKQITIELASSTPKPQDESQHLPDNYSRRTVQTQCNMYLWNYLNGKMEESGKNDPFSVPVVLPPPRKTVWTQCSFMQKAAPEIEQNTQAGSCVLGSGDVTPNRKRIIKEAIAILKEPQYNMLSYKILSMGKTKKSKGLHIINKEHYGILGHGVNPLTLTLTANGNMTLDVIYRPVEKICGRSQNKELSVDVFREILDQVTKYSFCPGMRSSLYKKIRRRQDVKMMNYPFKRWQSDSCPIWFKPENVSMSLYATQCSYCKEISDSYTLVKQSKESKRGMNTLQKSSAQPFIQTRGGKNTTQISIERPLRVTRGKNIAQTSPAQLSRVTRADKNTAQTSPAQLSRVTRADKNTQQQVTLQTVENENPESDFATKNIIIVKSIQDLAELTSVSNVLAQGDQITTVNSGGKGETIVIMKDGAKPRQKIFAKETQKVVVEPIQSLDPVLECCSDLEK